MKFVLTLIHLSFLDIVVQTNPIAIKDISVKNAAPSTNPLFIRAGRPKLSLVKYTLVIANFFHFELLRRHGHVTTLYVP